MFRWYGNGSSATMTSLSIGADSNNTESVNLQQGSSITTAQGSSGNLQTMASDAFVAVDAEL